MEDPELKRLMQENLELNKENNLILKKLLRVIHWNQFWSIVKWVIIIGSALGAYYFLQPYLTNLFQVYADLLSPSQHSTSTDSSSKVRELFRAF